MHYNDKYLLYSGHVNVNITYLKWHVINQRFNLLRSSATDLDVDDWSCLPLVAVYGITHTHTLPWHGTCWWLVA